MEIGIIGLGRMGGNIAVRLMKGGCRVWVYDVNSEAVDSLKKQGANGADSISTLAAGLAPPRSIWVMVPAGEPTETVINLLSNSLSPGDIVVDGGNSYYKDSVRRSKALASNKIEFLDVGTSGGVWGLTEGYCLMVGGPEEAYRRLEPVFQILAASGKKGYGHVGPSGAGHFVKMVHNGIEYALMEAYAEGFELLQAKKEFGLDLPQVAELWRSGSVVRSWLLDLTAATLKEHPGMEGVEAFVEDSGEGRWTVQEALELAVPVPAIAESLQVRFRSRQSQPFANRLLAALRFQFGGHQLHR